jgi:hypothetical protein
MLVIENARRKPSKGCEKVSGEENQVRDFSFPKQQREEY